ncbi:AzlD domain-containing protein [Pseudogulbenkiania sp. MAI-1]|uniref:AzlD domain-containing protein n=1 Tax=Pseudogulbenkiania sp. MAI-1 TaxID=990370 RepID=UPI000A034EA7|nr:AzlD domain-containing protein [Pseudogulbenkiania sp. MAI-1]
MTDKLFLWLTFILIGAATLLPRSSFIVVGHKAQLPPKFQKALRYAPAAAIAALVAPDILMVDGNFVMMNPKFFASVAAVFSIIFLRNPWLPFVAGIGVLTGIKFL